MDSTAAGFEVVDAPSGWRVGRLAILGQVQSVAHLVSTRDGPNGASVAAGDEHAWVNRLALMEILGARRLVCARQVHGVRVADADTARDGEVGADAVMTNRPGVALMGLSADCALVLVADAVTGAVGMAHAGWRGTLGGVVAGLVGRMSAAYGCRPADMLAGLCPSAGPCCYEVGDDVAGAAREAGASDFVELRGGRTYFDLWRANVEQLTRAGLRAENVQVAGVCTICDGRFFSVRREGKHTGRFAGMIARVEP